MIQRHDLRRTDFHKLSRQPLFQERLNEYPVFAEGDGYIIYLIGQ